MITVFFLKKGKSVTSRVLRKTRTLYNRVSTSEKPEHTRNFSFPLSLLPLSQISLFSPFFSLLSSFSSSSLLFPLLSSGQQPLRRAPAHPGRRTRRETHPGDAPKRGTRCATHPDDAPRRGIRRATHPEIGRAHV